MIPERARVGPHAGTKELLSPPHFRLGRRSVSGQEVDPVAAFMELLAPMPQSLEGDQHGVTARGPITFDDLAGVGTERYPLAFIAADID